MRVSLKEQRENILVPFVALRWDEEKIAHLTVVGKDGSLDDRTVKTGRAVGDRIEIVDGLMAGEQYVSGAMDESGMKNKIKIPATKEDNETSSESGHGGHEE